MEDNREDKALAALSKIEHDEEQAKHRKELEMKLEQKLSRARVLSNREQRSKKSKGSAGMSMGMEGKGAERIVNVLRHLDKYGGDSTIMRSLAKGMPNMDQMTRKQRKMVRSKMGTKSEKKPRTLFDNIPSARAEMVSQLEKFRKKANKKRNKKARKMVDILQAAIQDFDVRQEEERRLKETMDIVKQKQTELESAVDDAEEEANALNDLEDSDEDDI